MDRTQFTFYESFYKALSRIRSGEERAFAYDAICAYALYGTEPDMDALPDAAAIAFELIRPNLDSSRRKANSGKSGGSGKQTGSKPEANEKQTVSKPEASPGKTGSKKEKEDKKEDKKEGEIEKEYECTPQIPPKGTRFTKPSLEDVIGYCQERGGKVDPYRFYDYYEANGWRVGKNPMKDWRAAVRNWERQESGPPKQEKRDTGFRTSNPFLEMLEEEYG